MPHWALPRLTSYLRSHGVGVIQRDLNVETFDTILTRTYLAQVVDRLRRDYRAHSSRWPAPRRSLVEWALALGAKLVAQIEDAMRVLRSDALLDGPTGLSAFQTMLQSMAVASLPFFPAALDFSTYTPWLPADKSQGLLKAVQDPQHNMFLDLFRRGIVADIAREQPNPVGISIPTLEQTSAAMTLAYLIKQAGLACHITLGGPHITMLREELPRVTALFDLLDSAVICGEKPLMRLVEALDGHGDLSQVPNLIYRHNGRVHATPYEGAEEITSLPLPDFDGLPLDRYLAPRLVLLLSTSRGCYHGRCAFCSVGYGAAKSFRQLPVEHVVAQMLALHDKYGVRHIFADKAITPHTLAGMSSVLEAQGAPIHWCGCARFEKALMIMRRMAKGTQREQVSRILHQSATAGIWNHVFFSSAFPARRSITPRRPSTLSTNTSRPSIPPRQAHSSWSGTHQPIVILPGMGSNASFGSLTAICESVG